MAGSLVPLLGWTPPHRAWRPQGELWKPWSPPAVDLAMLRTVHVAKRRRPDPQLYDPATDTRAQIYYEDCRFLDAPTAPITTLEVARFPAIGKIGIVKGLWTWAETEAAPPLAFFGTVFDPRYLARNGDEVKWFLRLSQRGNYPIGPLWTGTEATLPGFAYHELPYWNESRFLWGSPTPTFFLVPRDMTLRLFVTFSRLVLVAGARMWGYHQTVNMPTSSVNTRHGWT